MKRGYVPFLLAVLLAAAASAAIADVKAWEGTLTLPTHPWEPDDVNPKFYGLEGSIIYPYTMQDDLSNEAVDRTYRTLCLENEFLRVTCIPELGGRIHSVFDKTTGEEMFHTNSVIKPGLIAMRGAWISGGIEWNTGPHGHTVTIVDPVDAMLLENEDGSATLLISNIEKIFRTRWSVALTLHPGRAYLDETIRMYNPTDGVHPYYFWNCTAFYCLPGTKFIYPMTLGTNHNGDEFFSWPIHEGTDIRWLKNYDRPSSIFAYGCEFDFFGAYDVDLDRGIVQYADHHVLMGKKAWTWGQSGDGIVSQRNLHAGDEQYIEVQSGPLLTQADYGLLHPRQEVSWREFWYPVHGLGDGFEYATRDAAIQATHHDDALELRILGTGVWDDVICKVRAGSVASDYKIALSPEKPAVLRHVNPLADEYDIELLAFKRDGTFDILASFTTPLPIPEVEPPDDPWLRAKANDELSVEEMYLKGQLYDKQTDRPAAREWYGRVLEADPLHNGANRSLAVLDLEAGAYDMAVGRLNKALERDPDDAMAWFYLGSVQFGKGDYAEAIDCAYKTIKFQPSLSIGYDLAGRGMMREVDEGLGRPRYLDAAELFKTAMDMNPADTRAANHYNLALLAHDLYTTGGRLFAARRAVTDPADIVNAAILSVHESGDVTALRNHLADNVGEVEFELLEAASVFMNLGLYREAFEVLQAIEDERFEKERSSLSLYYLAYLADRLGYDQSAGDYWERAAGMTSDYVFPARVETEAVLLRGIEANPGDAKARLALGNLFAGRGQLGNAADMWRQAAGLDESLSVAFRNLGLYTWRETKDLSEAEALYRKAIEARPKDKTLHRDLARILLEQNRRREAIEWLAALPADVLRTDTIEILAQAYVDEKEYTKAIDLLSGAFFSNWENRTVSRNVYERAHLERGKEYMEAENYERALNDFKASLEYPEHLGVGRPAEPLEAESYYWLGAAHAKLGQTDKAREAWQTAAAGRRGPGSQNQHIEMSREALGGL